MMKSHSRSEQGTQIVHCCAAAFDLVRKVEKVLDLVRKIEKVLHLVLKVEKVSSKERKVFDSILKIEKVYDLVRKIEKCSKTEAKIFFIKMFKSMHLSRLFSVLQNKNTKLIDCIYLNYETPQAPLMSLPFLKS